MHRMSKKKKKKSSTLSDSSPVPVRKNLESRLYIKEKDRTSRGLMPAGPLKYSLLLSEGVLKRSQKAKSA